MNKAFLNKGWFPKGWFPKLFSGHILLIWLSEHMYDNVI